MPNDVQYYPALQAQMGDWVYYTITMRFEDLKNRIKRVDQIHETHGLKTWLQRSLGDTRLKQISEYIRTQPQRFFSAVVVGIYRGDIDWYQVVVSKGVLHADITLPERVKTAFGIIRLSGDEDLFAIDGQHRVEGIKLALRESSGDPSTTNESGNLADEEQTVILVSHRTDQPGHQRTRRLFFTLNRYAKRVSQGELIALSEDDTFAVVTRKLSELYSGLDEDHVPLLKSPNLTSSNKRILLSVITLYEVIKVVSYPYGSKCLARLKSGPTREEDIDRIYNNSTAFWDALQELSSPVREILTSPPDDEIAGQYRHSQGGHFLLRPLCIKLFADAVGILHARGVPLKTSIRSCLKAPMELSQEPWRGLVWMSTKKGGMLKGNDSLVRNVILRYAGAKLEPESFDLAAEYERVVGRSLPANIDAVLGDI